MPRCDLCGSWFADEDELKGHEGREHGTSILDFAGEDDAAE